MRCALCGARPAVPKDVNPRNLREMGAPAATDQVGGTFFILATCQECFLAVVGVLRSATGVLRAETDLAPMLRVEAAPAGTSTPLA